MQLVTVSAAAAAAVALIAVPAAAHVDPPEGEISPTAWNAQEQKLDRLSMAGAEEPQTWTMYRRAHEGHRASPASGSAGRAAPCMSVEARQADDEAATAYLVARAWEPTRAAAAVRKLNGAGRHCW